MENRVIAILGTTASGKSSLARALAAHLNAEIISIDSMKVYRGMDIGTAKPSADARAATRHHLIDVAEPHESFSVARFVELADQAVEHIHAKGKPAIAVGGTILYFKCFYQGLFAGPAANPKIRARIRARAASEGLQTLHAELARIDPDAAQRIHPNDLRRIERALEVYEITGQPITHLQKQWSGSTIRRPDWKWKLIALRWPRDEGNRRINDRVRKMVAHGLIDEARQIWSDPRGVSDQARQAVGYAELFQHFQARLTQDQAIERIKINSRQLAKSQRTWLKRLPEVQWIDLDPGDDVQSTLSRVLPLIQ